MAASAPSSTPPKRLWRQIASALIAVAALAYLGYLVMGSAGEFTAALFSLSLGQISGALLAAIGMLLLKAVYHVLLSQRLSGRSRLARAVLPAYCLAQLARYLPGKIWGILYQANRLSGTLRADQVVTANAIQTITTNLLGIGVIGSVLGAAHSHSPWPLAGLAVAVAATELVHRYPVMERRLLALLARLSRRDIPVPDNIPPQRWTGTLILCGEWIAYFAIWFIIAGEEIAPLDTIVLGTWYAAASLLAIVAVVVPAGLAVREAIFVTLGTLSSVNPAALVAYAALLRLVLTIGELACVPIAAALSRRLPEARQ